MGDGDGGPTSHRFISQRLALNYLDWGNRDAPTLILVHGGRDHARSWDWVAHQLRHEWHVICPDLRGHGDSAWSPDASYAMPYYVADLAQLVHQLGKGAVSIVAHSLGGAVAMRYSGVFPENVRRLAVIEGLGPSPLDRPAASPIAHRWRAWIIERRAFSGRKMRHYATLEEAEARMRQANPQLSAEQIRHLTIHGIIMNEDGSYSWKFDNYVRSGSIKDLTDDDLHTLWHNIDCPVWLVHGADSWARHPGVDGRADYFRHSQVTSYENAGHWVHHDRFDSFVTGLKAFL